MIGQALRSARKQEYGWRYLWNWAPSLAYRMSPASLEGEPRRILDELNRNGIAITSFSALFGPDSPLFRDMTETVERLQAQHADAIRQARSGGGSTLGAGEKAFLVELLGERPTLDPASPFGLFALNRSVLQIANMYYGMYTRLRTYNVWHTVPSSNPPSHSQLWHRDREDRYILKAFAYLTDVDESAGPFTYAPATHLKGVVKREPAMTAQNGVSRGTDSAMAEVLPKSSWARCTGEKGTIIFADTRGYHKGGYATGRDRVAYMCMFTSPASDSKELFERPLFERPLSERPGTKVAGVAEKALAVATAGPRRGPWLTLPAVR